MVREDGKVFVRYQSRRGLRSEFWTDPETFQKIKLDENEASRRYRDELKLKTSKEKRKEYHANWASENHEKISDKRRKYRLENKEKLKEYAKAWRRANPEKVKAYSEKWETKVGKYQSRNRPEINKRRKQWVENGGHLRKITLNTRSRIHYALKKNKKLGSESYLGCSYEELKNHIESCFIDGMSWDNYGSRGWHIDHRVPISSALTLEALIPLLHFSNLQPLWWIDNLKKGSKVC